MVPQLQEREWVGEGLRGSFRVGTIRAASSIESPGRRRVRLGAMEGSGEMDVKDEDTVRFGKEDGREARPMKVVVAEDGSTWLCDADADVDAR